MKIGYLNLDHPLALAPMEDVSDHAFRLICKRLGADLLYTEFTSSEGLIRGIPAALNKIKITDQERPIAIQLFGGMEGSMEKAAQVAECCQPDFIDLNCGCWVKNHVARGEGAALLKDLPRFESIVKATVRATKLPVTVKTRLGWDQDTIVIVDVAKMVEQAGCAALCVHCRTRAQAHNGSADWQWLERIKKVISIPLIGNGDVKTPEDVKRMLEIGCDGVMIGREAIANPWIFQQSKLYLETGEVSLMPSVAERIELAIEHLNLSVQDKGPWEGVVGFRKHWVGYLKGLPHVAKLRADVMHLVDVEQVVARLYRFLDQSSLISRQPSVSKDSLRTEG